MAAVVTIGPMVRRGTFVLGIGCRAARRANPGANNSAIPPADRFSHRAANGAADRTTHRGIQRGVTGKRITGQDNGGTPQPTSQRFHSRYSLK